MSSDGRTTASRVEDAGPEPPRFRPSALLSSGIAQFSGQALGIVIAVLISHLIARRLGVGPEADAFLLGRRIVTSLGEMLSQIVVVVFIPLVAAQAATGHSVGRILTRAGGMALSVGVALAVTMVLLARFLVDTLAPKFDPDTATLAAHVVMILALSLPATVATVAFASYCNVRGRFGLPSMIRQVPRAAVAATFLVGGGALALKAATAYSVAFFAVAALTLGLALRLRPGQHRNAAVRRGASTIERSGVAAILLTVGALASIWLETTFAAGAGVGGVAMLDYSQRLGALCGNTLGAALALVTFADLSRRAVAEPPSQIDRRFGHATLTALALLLPLQIGLAVNADAVVDVVIAHGAFSASAKTQVADLLRWMAIAPLGALLSRMLLVRVLAAPDLPIVRLVGGAIALDVLLRFTLFTALTPVMGLLAIPVSLVVAPAGPILFLAIFLYRHEAFQWLRALKSARSMLIVSALCSIAIMAGASLGPAVASALTPFMGDMPKLDSLSRLAASVVLAGLALGASFRFLHVRPRLT